jgi:glycosyltransferase involved in cell wall biosynthesis
MKILQVITSMDPALGGLSAFVRSLTPALIELGHVTEIVCLDDPASAFLTSLPGPLQALGPARYGYAYSPRLLPWLKAHAPRFDAVIVHGLWQYPGFATRRALSAPGSPPYFVFSHGMLDPWFKRTYPLKHLKKWFYWWLAERRTLGRAAAVLFTCEEERTLARHSFPGNSYRERVVAFGTARPPEQPTRQREAFFQKLPHLRDRPFWLFLARLHPKKGVDLLIEAYAKLASSNPAVPHLVIAGPCADADFLRKLQSRAATSCPEGSVSWPGMLAGDVKWGALRAAETFILPSHQENFGIAVVEALACGTPVLISNQVNIWREIAADGVGLVEPDTDEGTFQLLQRWFARDRSGDAALRTAAVHTFSQRYEIGAAARSLVSALQTASVAPFPEPTRLSPNR